MARKIHPGAKLKTLDEDIQESLWDWLCDDPKRTLAQAKDWLEDEYQIETRVQRLSEWRGWYARTLEIRTAESEASELEQLLSTKALTLTPDQISAIGNAVFLNRATKLGDAKTFVQVAGVVQRSQELKASQQGHKDKMSLAERKLKVEGQKLDLEERRVKLLEDKIKSADEVMKTAVKKGGLTPETRAAIRAELGMPKEDEP
ncbi:hypothetical protein GCM10023213_14140 [Prosthecobacter algae]|uniref:Phage terminase small subunit n=1 Tax=Prosthecobacter algae TaxID=1144682 RepID=A0ABP9NZK9_9BACT